MNIQERFQDIQWEKLDRLSPIILLLLILALCWKLASVFWWVLAPPQVIQPEPVVLGSKQTQVPNISSFSLFYEQGASTSVNDNLAMQLQDNQKFLKHFHTLECQCLELLEPHEA